jgi:2',3'-cyclic-nucleotide 2'-phosphodiesterase
MRILFCGDVVGRAGRKVLLQRLPELRPALRLDAVVVNGENAAGGFGITPALCQEFYAAGADLITTGNHVFDQRELVGYSDRDPRLIRPLNMLPGTPGRGSAQVALPDGRRLLVLQVIGRLFMGSYDDPFRALEGELARYPLGASVQAIVVDLHAEATSEKMALGHLADGRASLVAGTHTHVPTADAQILPGGTAFVSDIGMTGDYDSVIGMSKGIALQRFRSHVPGPRNTPALGDATLCAMFLETDDATGLARRIAPVRLGGRLPPAWPEEA